MDSGKYEVNVYWKYFKYVCWHKYCVLIACWKRGLVWRGIVHDMSKFLPSEFIPYARFFHGKWPTREQVKLDIQYGTDYPDALTKEGVRETWERAFLHHIHYNNHHWQHWLFTDSRGYTKPLVMTLGAWKEMLADWEGAGKSITGNLDTLEWYTRNRKRIILHPLVKQLTDEFVGVPPTKRD